MTVQDNTSLQQKLRLQQKLKLSRTTTLSTFIVLLASLTGSTLSGGNDPILLIPVLVPLLIFLPSIIKSRPDGLIFLCFVSLLYFCIITTNLFEPDRSIYDILALLAVVILFIGSMLFSRWQKKFLREQHSTENNIQETKSLQDEIN